MTNLWARSISMVPDCCLNDALPTIGSLVFLSAGFGRFPVGCAVDCSSVVVAHVPSSAQSLPEDHPFVSSSLRFAGRDWDEMEVCLDAVEFRDDEVGEAEEELGVEDLEEDMGCGCFKN